MFLRTFNGLLKLNICNFGCLLLHIRIIFISVINNLDDTGFSEYQIGTPMFSIDPEICSGLFQQVEHIS